MFLFLIIMQESGIHEHFYYFSSALDFDTNPNVWTPEEETEELKKAFTKTALPSILLILISMEFGICIVFAMENKLKWKMIHYPFNIIIELTKTTLESSKQIIWKGRKIFGVFCSALILGVIILTLVLLIFSPKENDIIQLGKK